MKFYLSSYGIGNQAEKLKELVKGKIAFIPNAMDYQKNIDHSSFHEERINELRALGIDVEYLDLKEFFKKENELKKILKNFHGVWVRGGNTFVLRQAMKLSGFDKIISEMSEDFLYGGYSAGICVLAPKLDALQQVDQPYENPYDTEIIWEGLKLLDYIILPHYKSEHPESTDIDKEIEYCERNNIPYKTLRDGEVIIL